MNTFKKIALGVAIFALTVVFIAFVNKSVNPKPEYKSCYPVYDQYSGYNNSCGYSGESYDQQLKDYRTNSFLIITALSLLAVLAGVLVRSVAPISWGLGLAGVVMIFYIFIYGYVEIAKPYRALISGLALFILIWISYAKLGDKELLNDSTPVHPTPSPLNNPPSAE